MKNTPNKSGSKTTKKQEPRNDHPERTGKQSGDNKMHPEKKSKYPHDGDTIHEPFQKSDPASRPYMNDDDSYDDDSFGEEEE